MSSRARLSVYKTDEFVGAKNPKAVKMPPSRAEEI
jgi:hypothetical protein